jgi:hypothetical protein
VWTAIARPIGSKREAEIEDAVRSNEDQVLLVLDQSPGLSMANIARALNWYSEKINEKGEKENVPMKSKVQRALDVLKEEKLAGTERGKWVLTPKGKTTAQALRNKAS